MRGACCQTTATSLTPVPSPSTQDAILAATERLLRERRLSELSVGDIIAAAGISRTSFYAYFGSKTAVVAECLRRVTGQVAVAVEPFLTEWEARTGAAIRASLGRWVEVCTVHGALMRTVSEVAPRQAAAGAVVRDPRRVRRRHRPGDPLRPRPGARHRRAPMRTPWRPA